MQGAERVTRKDKNIAWAEALRGRRLTLGRSQGGVVEASEGVP